ncbi:hypothetical protein [Pseudomonas viridiflava]|uniref:hypothetical protein n=1 Tax=Pseudomonas viridiflava TaxID=33069 RepID=UPI001F1305F8|nr:hypothetical protein [Pseudomonas viridiflava]
MADAVSHHECLSKAHAHLGGIEHQLNALDQFVGILATLRVIDQIVRRLEAVAQFYVGDVLAHHEFPQGVLFLRMTQRRGSGQPPTILNGHAINYFSRERDFGS